jgi:hypothetical protein
VGCDCGPGPREGGDYPDQPYVIGHLDTLVGPVPRVRAELTAADRRGTWMARWGVGRMDYRVAPGLYALGDADRESPVLVSANYKMSFDALRSSMAGRVAWLLVLDTAGINVWCAAGKGTFGTDELVSRIESTGLHALVERKRVIVPQLGAPGVAAHEVKARARFAVRYGPIEAADLPGWLDARGKATPQMRRKTFALGERAELIGVELTGAIGWGLVIAAAVAALGGLGGSGGYWANVLAHGSVAALAVVLGVLAGTVVTPLALPWLPGRAFAVKGAFAGLVLTGGLVAWLATTRDMGLLATQTEMAAVLLLSPTIAAFLGMNFTGASTYTSLSGVIKEMRYAVPAQAITMTIALGLWITSRWVA